MFYVSLHNRKIIKKMIGEEVNYFYLKRWTMRVRKLFLKKKEQTPEVFLLKTKSKKYKLVISHKEGNQQIKKIIKNYKFVEHLNYTPKILWSNENFLISEYLEGNFANFENVNFEIQLAKLLADVHKINQFYVKKNRVINDVKHYINNLKNVFKFSNDLIKSLEILMPDNFVAGMTYGDHNVDNYVWSEGKLKLIDFGSFVDGDIVDIHLCSSPFFKKINLKNFKNNYLKNGGNNFLFKNKDLLKYIALLRSASYNFDRYKSCPQYDWRQVNDRLINVKNAIENEIFFKKFLIENRINTYFFPKNFLRKF